MNSEPRRICAACVAGARTVNTNEMSAFVSEHPNWVLFESDGVARIQRAFPFADYMEAVDFADEIAVLAEFEDHHPAILLEWGKVTITWWTHKIGGVHMNDLLMATETDNLFASRHGRPGFSN